MSNPQLLLFLIPLTWFSTRGKRIGLVYEINQLIIDGRSTILDFYKWSIFESFDHYRLLQKKKESGSTIEVPKTRVEEQKKDTSVCLLPN